MQIKDARHPDWGLSKRGFTTLLLFNLEIADGVLLYDLTLQRSPDGRLFLYSPLTNGRPTSAFSPAVRSAIISLAQDVIPDGQTKYAA